MKNEIRVFAPASVTNVGCGFDVMGFAIYGPGDEVILRLKKEPGIFISKITGENGRLPLETLKNTAGLSLKTLAEHLLLKTGVEIEIHKKMPLGSGLGSSAASAVASVFALNKILGSPLNKKELLPFALKGESLTCGGRPHADNVSACLLGGFTIVRSLKPLDIINIDVPADLYCTIVHPHFEINTADTRKVLRKYISLSNTTKQLGNVAGLVAGLIKSDHELIGRSLQDFISEPIRSKLIPGFMEMKNAAIQTGAVGCNISGSGPSVFAFSKSNAIAQKAGTEMQKILAGRNIKSDVYISKINKQGPKVIK